MQASTLIFTCEHGGNQVPRAYQRWFVGAKALLQSHRGYDPGALDLARRFAKNCGASLFHSTTTRLLIELNRSQHHPHLFSSLTRSMPPGDKRTLLEKFYLPYRTQVTDEIREQLQRKIAVVHISVHSFTPQLDGQLRNCDIGWLYDSTSAHERRFCDAWMAAFRAQEAIRPMPERTRLRRNFPYRGAADGFTTALRRDFAEYDVPYLGIELEINQRFPHGSPKEWTALQKLLVDSLRSLQQSR